ncbi:hypothetical protein F7D09_0753 [Bifidobacterium leontopitheci]|uniref:Uncharacterized protein n=2 Tax=Bifidobacterium leontopitheci TaxID=2650774 RepID=A0A6I1GMT6_9BIFI|nr:hypothetical protein F7D09_0753 [Bifidobacterium leontopitheci]
MTVTIRPLTMDQLEDLLNGECHYADELEKTEGLFSSQTVDAPLLADQYWQLMDCALAYGVNKDCFRCHRRSPEFAIYIRLQSAQTDGLEAFRLVPLSTFDYCRLLATEFKQYLWSHCSIRLRTSKMMNNTTYLSNGCPFCDVIWGDNFVMRNYRGQGGMFSNSAYDTTPIYIEPLPLFADMMPRQYPNAFNLLSRGVRLDRLMRTRNCPAASRNRVWTRILSGDVSF